MKIPKKLFQRIFTVAGVISASWYFVQCSKKAPESVESRQKKSEYLILKEIGGKKLKHIKQAFITDLRGGHFINFGRKLAGRASVKSDKDMLARGGVADSLSLDSTVWLLEACINYNFDYYNSIWDTTSIVAMPFDTIGLTISISNAPLTCAFDDAQAVYDSLSHYMSTNYTGDVKAYAIDVEGYIFDPNAGIGYITIVIIPVNTSNDFWNPCLCNPNATSNGYFDTDGSGSSACSCGNQIGFDGAVMLQNILNCYWNPCRPAQSTWSNIAGGLVVFWTSTNNFLNTGWYTCSNWCSTASANRVDCTILAQQKTYMENEANSFTPTFPPGMSVMWKQLWPQWSTNVSGLHSERYEEIVSYGVRNCGPLTPIFYLMSN